MILLGLHFGHDAAVSIVRDGEVLLCVERERLARVKHAITLLAGDVERCLADVGLTVDDVDLAALTSTQDLEYVFLEPDRLSVAYAPHPGHTLPCTLVDRLKISPAELDERLLGNMLRALHAGEPSCYGDLLPDWRKVTDEPPEVLGDLQHFVHYPIWNKVCTLRAMATADYRALLASRDLRLGFHYPATLRLLGRKLPAYVVAHHAAHVAYTFYTSPHERAAVLSTDGTSGSLGYLGGFLAYGEGDHLFPFSPSFLNVGPLYDRAAVELGFGLTTGAGKLMGLSAYGRPRFFRPELVGTYHELPPGKRETQDWVDHCRREATALGYDLTALGDRSRVLEPAAADFAASTQMLSEKILLAAARSLQTACARTGGRQRRSASRAASRSTARPTRASCARGRSTTSSAPPAGMDSGLSIGSALWLYHNVISVRARRRRASRPGRGTRTWASRRGASAESVERGLAAFSGRVHALRADPSAAEVAAADLEADRIVGWFQGGARSARARSGTAPSSPTRAGRELGAGQRVKGREAWRPLAPRRWRTRHPAISRMARPPRTTCSSTRRVGTTELPATHARGRLRPLPVGQRGVRPVPRSPPELRAADGDAGRPNTSFNGPDEPIVETPEEAIELMLARGLDVLYLGEWRVEKVGGEGER